jgi:hypothetical protein
MSLLIPTKRQKHFSAMALIGHGVMALVHPQRDATAWIAGPQVWQNLINGLHQRPVLTRALVAAQLLVGISAGHYIRNRKGGVALCERVAAETYARILRMEPVIAA